MTGLISDNLFIILIAVLIGVIVGWWVLRRPAGTARTASTDPLAEVPHEGHSLADEDVAAAADIAGALLRRRGVRRAAGAVRPPGVSAGGGGGGGGSRGARRSRLIAGAVHPHPTL